MQLGGRTGKRAFATALNVITPYQDRFIEHLSTLRNRMAHDPRDAGLTLGKYLGSLQEKERRKFAASVAGVLLAGEKLDDAIQVFDDGVRLKADDLVLNIPQFTLWMAGMMFIVQIYVERFRRESLRAAILGLQSAIEETARGESEPE